MRRALGLVLLATGLGLSAAPTARAQNAVRLGVVGDTAFGAVPGAPTTVIVSATNSTYDYSGCYYSPYYTYSDYCITHARLTFVYDPALIEVIAAEPTGSGLATLSGASSGSGLFTVTASGVAAGYETQLFRLRVRLGLGASDGAYLWVRVDSLRTPNYVLAGSGGGVRSSIGQACHASEMWGDVDGIGGVTSRDALITLSAAVGLPVAGFESGLATLGDVDGDGLANSRDALMMLSYAVDVPTETASRVGSGLTDACPGPTAPGETVVFQRSGTAAGLYRIDAVSTTPVPLTTNADDRFPRLDASGQNLIFECDPISTSQLCRSDQAGTGRRYLDSTGAAQSRFPDWSPDGAKITFLQSGFVSLMDSSGSAASRVYLGEPPTYGANGVAWSRDGTLLAFSNMSNGIKTIRLSDSVETLLTTPAVTDGDQIRWSPDGANVLFSRSDWSIWSVSATEGTEQRLAAFQGGSRGFDVGPQGILFTATGPAGGNAVWLLQGGPTGPIVRITAPPAGNDDLNPSFRRNP